MRIRKYHPNKSVLFVTFSLEEGLLLLANPLCKAIVKSCLARAQFLHPVRISAFIVQANHIHMIMVVDNPEDVSLFMKCFKTESAHMLNRILGRKKRTVWCQGFDSPIVLTPRRAMISLTYLYANPVKDHLVESIKSFPGLSSWKMFTQSKYTMRCKRLRRPSFRKLSNDAHNLRAYCREAHRIMSKVSEVHDLTLMPNAWMEAFGIIDSFEQENINKRIIERVNKLEQRVAVIRARYKRKVLGSYKLVNQVLNTNYRSNRSGKRSICLSDNRYLKKKFIRFIRGIYSRAAEVYKRWKMGDLSIPYPLGLFPPRRPRLAEPIHIW